MRTLARSWISGSSTCSATRSSNARIAFSNCSACISLIADSYACTALAKCVDRRRSDDVDDPDADWPVPLVRTGSIRADFEICLRTAVFTLGLDPFRAAFLVPFREEVFAGLAFKWTNLPRVAERLDAFFVAL